VDTTAAPFPGESELPRYHVVRTLSETAMSRVYLAEDTALHGRRVAVKVLAPHLAHVPGFRERFVREVRIAATLQHPNVIDIIAATDVPGRGDEPLYLVMPYVDGPDLRTLLRASGPLDPDRTVHLARQVASALDHAHQRGIVHRDVKPGNILLGADDHVYLCDFGIASEADGERLTGTWLPPGTPGYMAPERFDPARADPAAPPTPAIDVYALGAVVYQCLTGRPPFDLGDNAAVLQSQLHADPPPVSALRKGLPRAVDAVVRRALSRDPLARPRTCRELVDELDRAVHGHRLPAVRVGPAVRGFVRRLSPRRRVAMLGAVVLVAVAAVVVATRFGGSGAPDVARVPAPLRSGCATADGSAGLPGAASVLNCSADGRTVTISLFDDQSTLDSAYAGAVRASGVASGTGDCTAAPGGEHRYPADGTATGRVLCYSRTGLTDLVWTDDAERTIASVSAPASDLGLTAAWQRWAAVPGFPTPAEKSLTDLVGLAHCRRAPGGDVDRFTGVVAAVRCDPPGTGAAGVSYYRFASVDALRHGQAAQAAAVHAPSGVLCFDGTAPGFLGESSLDLRSVVVGDLLCYRDSGNDPVYEWTEEPLLVMGRADGADPAKLATWWGGYFGFGGLTPALAAAADRQARPPFPTAPEQALLDHIPAASRVDCMRPPPSQVQSNVGTAPVTAVVCGPTRGASIVFYYRFSDAVTMNAAYADNNDTSGADCTTQPADFHGDAPYHNGAATGRLGCVKLTNGPSLTWTNDAQEILTMAFGGGDPGILLDWWRFDAGPN
jgi:tRNA A-37 threonylcarbamoyl transferase component Bud32